MDIDRATAFAWADAGIISHRRYFELCKEKGWSMPKEMPIYVCHKRVRALEIKYVGSYRPVPNTDKLEREVVFVDRAFAPMWMPGEMFLRYVPLPGDFYLVYDDGYQSFSPRKAFLEGYTLETKDREKANPDPS